MSVKLTLQRGFFLGKPRLGDNTKTQIRIKESKEFRNTVDKLLKRANAKLLVGTSSWKEQFQEALTVGSGDDEDDQSEPGAGGLRVERAPAFKDYVVHLLTVFWKLVSESDYY